MKEILDEFKDMIFMLERTMAKGFSALNQRMDNFEARLVPLETKVSNIEVIVTDTREELDAVLAAIDKNAVMLLEHGKRIGRLEKRIA